MAGDGVKRHALCCMPVGIIGHCTGNLQACRHLAPEDRRGKVGKDHRRAIGGPANHHPGE